MMELRTCALVVSLVSLVTATPYGYGVKGGAGAAARADSIAAASAFGDRGDIPPFGGGFSGSFSKSSSASSSSSSASASSSSFSYSSSGTGGLSGPGCTTGRCQISGANDISANHGANGADSGLHGYNAAKAGAIAGSGAISGANCHGPTCDNSVEKCSPGQCQPKLQTGTAPSSYDADNKCASGQCGAPSPTALSALPYDDSDDIHFVAHSSKSAQDAKDQSSNHGKASGFDSGSNCRGGSCGPSTNFNSKPSYSHGSTDSYQNVKPSTYFNFGSTPSYHIPSTDLETPKQDSNCNSGNCKDEHGNLPSSYNVPSRETYDIPTQKPSCHDGKCENPHKGSYSSTTSNALSTNYLSPHGSQPEKGSSYYPGSTNCAGSNCDSAPSSDRPSGTGSTDIHPGAASPSCSSPNCNPYYTASLPSGPYGQPGQVSPSGPADKDKPSNNKLPVYTGGFGAPPGVFKPNEYHSPTAGANSPSPLPSTPIQSQPTFGNSPTGCNSPSCFGQVSSHGVNPQPSPFGSHSPNGDINVSGQKQPSYTGGFGGPAGMLKPNDYTIPAPVANKPIQSASPTSSSSPTGCNTPNCFGSSPTAVTSAASAQAGSYGIHKQQGGSVTVTSDKLPTYTGGFGGPAGMLKPNEFDIQATNLPSETGCKTPNCNTYTSGPGATVPSYPQSGSYGATKPSAGVDSSSDLPPYTGGFGGPAGVLKPNEFAVPHTAPNSHNPSYPGVLPSKSPVSNNLPGCTTPNCSPSSAGTTIGTYPQPSFGVTSPSSLPHQPSVTSPGVTSSYNRPVGVTNPSAPAVAPIGLGYITQPLNPTYSAGCKTGNCAIYPANSVPTDVHAPTGSYDVTNPNTNTKPQYTGGFGGPSGTVTPSDNSYNVPSTGIGSSNCKTANCANLPSSTTGTIASSGTTAGSSQQLPGYTSGFGAPLKPNDYSHPAGSVNPHDQNKPSTGASTPACSSGNCNPKVPSPSSPGYSAASSGAHASASSAASANAVAYSGGFGGPPGFLKPYDDGKVDLSKIVGGLNGGSLYGGGDIHSPHETKPGTLASGAPFDASTAGHLGAHSNIGAFAGSAAGATAYSGSSGSSNIGPYGTHQAAHGIKGSSPCGGGCSGGYQGGLNGSGSSAGAVARGLSSSGSFGTGGSFASSSASAHSSAGAYTKGGYGKR